MYLWLLLYQFSMSFWGAGLYQAFIDLPYFFPVWP